MTEKKIGYDDAYSLKTPKDSIKLYKKWAQTYDEDFALNSNYLSPKKISIFFNKHTKNTDTPILDVGAGTGLVGECLYKTGNKKIIGIDISSEMLGQAKLKKCYSFLVEADVTKKIPLKNNSIGAVVSAGTFTHGHVGADAFDELLRITKPGGLFVLSINSKVTLGASSCLPGKIFLINEQLLRVNDSNSSRINALLRFMVGPFF